MIGASANPARPSHGVMRSLRAAGYDVVAGEPARDRDRRPAVLPDPGRRGRRDRARRHRRRVPARRTCASSTRARPSPSARAACGCSWASPTPRPARIAHDGGPVGRHGPLHDRRAPAARGGLRPPAAPAYSAASLDAPPGGPDAPDPPARRARRLRAGRPPARRPEPRDADRRPLRRRPRGQPPGHLAIAACWATPARSTGSRSRSRRR